MKRVKRWRYYCDFCKKVGGQRPSMEKHERGCTNNPDRVCGLCEHCGELQTDLSTLTVFIDSYCADLPRVKIPEFSEQLEASGNKLDPMLKELRDLANNCPACILAALRQAKTETWTNFSFKTERDAWWGEENENQADRNHY